MRLSEFAKVHIQGPQLPPKSRLVKRRHFVSRASQCGPLAQLVERLHGMQKVTGSNPVRSTHWASSSPGRTLHSHCRGKRFESALVHPAQGLITRVQGQEKTNRQTLICQPLKLSGCGKEFNKKYRRISASKKWHLVLPDC